jgi:SAM domain (Sterile alpha motif)
MDIAAWLQGLGLERYVPAFRDNEIDWEVLPKLTSEDLREIGVAAIGHRRKLLDAIAALVASALTPAVTAAVSDTSAPPEAPQNDVSTPPICGHQRAPHRLLTCRCEGRTPCKIGIIRDYPWNLGDDPRDGKKRYPAGTGTSTNVRLAEAEVHAASMACCTTVGSHR